MPGTRHRRRHTKSRQSRRHRTRRVRAGNPDSSTNQTNENFSPLRYQQEYELYQPQYVTADNYSISEIYKRYRKQPCHMPPSSQESTEALHDKCKHFFDFKIKNFNKCAKAKALVHRQRELGCGKKTTRKGWW